MAKDRIQELFINTLAQCIIDNDPYRFNDVILGRPPLTKPQRIIIDTFLRKTITVVATANGMGKSHASVTLALYLLLTNQPCKVLVTAPSQNKLRDAFWGKLVNVLNNAPFKLPGRLRFSPQLKVEIDPEHYLLCFSTATTENTQGHHGPKIFAIIDEASDVKPDIYAGIVSWNPHKILMLGNPIRTDGFFYETAQKGIQNPDGDIGFVQISALESPHVNMERSPWGLADKSWLDMIRNIYGENSIYWKSHVLGEFSEFSSDALVPVEWLNMLAHAHKPKGPKRIAADLSEGVGRDHTVLLVRDDNGVIEIIKSNKWSLEVSARKVKELTRKHNVESHRITYDKCGLGADFAHQLKAVGIFGAKGFVGSESAPRVSAADRMRPHAGWLLRRRLDPDHFDMTTRQHKQQEPFYLPDEMLSQLRPQLGACSYSVNGNGKIEITTKEVASKMIGHSPDVLDALIISFAHPNL